MNVQLLTNESEVNRIGKNLSSVGTYTGILRESCSILNPTITIQGVSASAIKNVNYMYISDFSRYYYVDNITSLKNDLWEISGHVDVLETYSSQILSNPAVIARQESQYNLYLDDGQFRTYATPDIIVKRFPNSFPKSGSYVLLVVGG